MADFVIFYNKNGSKIEHLLVCKVHILKANAFRSLRSVKYTPLVGKCPKLHSMFLSCQHLTENVIFQQQQDFEVRTLRDPFKA